MATHSQTRQTIEAIIFNLTEIEDHTLHRKAPWMTGNQMKAAGFEHCAHWKMWSKGKSPARFRLGSLPPTIEGN